MEAKRLAASEAELQAEEAQRTAALEHMQAVREQMRLWWRYLILSTNTNPYPNLTQPLPCPFP